MKLRPSLNDDGGYVAVFVALCLPLLVGMCALAIDVANWQSEGAHLQKVVDDAALGGVVYLPGDPSQAVATANRLVSANVSAADRARMTVTAEPVPGRPSRLRVTVSSQVDNDFGAIFGRQQSVITRTSVADYAGPVPMGSPCNVFGSEPAGVGDVRYSNGDCGSNQLWLNIAGPDSPKINGDRFQARSCSGSPYLCSGSSNSEYDSDGYFYVIKARQAGTLNVQAFDPEFAAVDDHCNSNLNGAAAIAPALAPVPDPASRYAKGDGPFCTGDVSFGSTPVTTSFVFRGPYDGSNPLSAPILSSCPAKQFEGVNQDLAGLLKTSNSSTQARAVQAEFRRWVSLCTFTAPSQGDYLVQVLTNVSYGANAADSRTHGYTSGSGHNRMALRVHYVTGQPNTSVSLAGLLRMSVYANASALNSEFFLARVGSGAAGQVLKIDLYDIGDASVSGSLQVLPPTDAKTGAMPLTTFSGCRRQVNSTGGLTSMSSCQEGVGVGEFNGQLLTILVPIPSTYRCSDTDPAGCWIRIRYNFVGGIQDTTTWSANLDGDPVRLVE